MCVLLLRPLFPKSFWSFEKGVELVARKTLLSPLGCLRLRPQTWKFKRVDRIVRFVEQTAIPTPLFSMSRALPDTAL